MFAHIRWCLSEVHHSVFILHVVGEYKCTYPLAAGLQKAFALYT